jgi:hypothetical protein
LLTLKREELCRRSLLRVGETPEYLIFESCVCGGTELLFRFDFMLFELLFVLLLFVLLTFKVKKVSINSQLNI